MLRISVVIAFAVLSATAAAQQAGKPAAPRLAADDLAFLAGKWKGALEYLDFQDNKTKRKIGTSLDATSAKGALQYRFTYTEPNGKEVQGDVTKVTLKDGGAKVRFNDEEWQVAKAALDAKAGKYEVVLTRKGTDNKKAATLRRTLSREKDKLTIRTEVELEKAKPFVRNEITLTKE